MMHFYLLLIVLSIMVKFSNPAPQDYGLQLPQGGQTQDLDDLFAAPHSVASSGVQFPPLLRPAVLRPPPSK